MEPAGRDAPPMARVAADDGDADEVEEADAGDEEWQPRRGPQGPPAKRDRRGLDREAAPVLQLEGLGVPRDVLLPLKNFAPR